MPDVYSGRARVGTITTGRQGPVLRYDEDWRKDASSFPISLSMPLNEPEWGPERLTPWLMNLLPEGEPLRAMTRALGIAAEDYLGLIISSGRDLAGALSMRAPSEDAGLRSIEDDTTLERIINDLPARPFLTGDEGVAMSLAGAQEKLPVVLTGEGLAIPVNGAASTHILKPDIVRLPGSVQNEALCMVLARRCGLETADVTTGIAGAREYLLVTRYDRIPDGGRIRRLHQEDFCQALVRPPGAKYENNQTGIPGPSISEMTGVIREHMTARDINRFLDAIIFNIAVGNVDSHAKNYSLMIGPGRPELAPLYDLMSGLTWAGITQNHSQQIGGQRQGRYVFARHWRRMAQEAGLSAPAVLRRVAALTERIPAELPAAREAVAAMPAGAGAFLDTFVAEITARAATVRFNLDHDAQDPQTDDPVEQNPA